MLRRALAAALAAAAMTGGATGADAADPCTGEPEVVLAVEAQVNAFLTPWRAAKPAPAIGSDSSMQLAGCIQQRLVEKEALSTGRLVGYKVGLTSKAVQERFGWDQPVSGMLLDGMILPDGAELRADFGARAVWEADMLLVVGDERINEATTPLEALASVRAMRAFIELPDLAVDPAARMTGPVLKAINVGARYGVAGPEIPLEATEAVAESLRTVRITASLDGKPVAESTGEATLGHPLNVMLWLVSDLAQSGQRLRAGDLVSVGSYSPLVPPKAGQTVTVRYDGLPGSGSPQVSVRFQ